jgi:hypothetical protein
MARVLLCALNRPRYLDEATGYYNHHESPSDHLCSHLQNLLLLTLFCCILESTPWSPRLYFLRFVGLANKITPK